MSDRSNFKKLPTIAALGLITLLVQGCGSKVDCNSSKTKKSAIEIIQSHLNNAVWYRQMNAALTGEPELSDIKTLTRNDDLKQSQCSANYSITYNGKQREIEVAYDLAYLQDKGETEVKVAVTSVMGGLMAVVMREPPIRNGVEKILDQKTGNLQQKIEWKNNLKDGVEEIYNAANGKLIAKFHWENGQKNGAEKQWDATGEKLLVDLDWKDGKSNGSEKQWDATGEKLLVDLNWKDGKETGFQTTGNPSQNGIGYDEYQLKDGLYNGIHKHYTPRDFTPYGIYLYKVENYKDGKLDGLSQEFSESGKLSVEKNYKDGVEIQVNPQVQAANTSSQSSSPAPAAIVATSTAIPAAVTPAAVATDPAANSSPFAPSFDCLKTTTGTERLICSDRELSKLDVELMQTYKQLLSISNDKNSLKKKQNEWRKTQRDACSTADCTAKAYHSRVEDLESQIQYLNKPAQFRQ